MPLPGKIRIVNFLLALTIGAASYTLVLGPRWLWLALTFGFRCVLWHVLSASSSGFLLLVRGVRQNPTGSRGLPNEPCPRDVVSHSPLKTTCQRSLLLGAALKGQITLL